MTGLNLHNVVGDALAGVNPWVDLRFKRAIVAWTPSARTPTEIPEFVTVKGKIQPANLDQMVDMGFNVQSYQYYKIFLSLNATECDKIRQLKSDTFTSGGVKYVIVTKNDWFQNGFRECYAYAEDMTDEEGNNTVPDNSGNSAET